MIGRLLVRMINAQEGWAKPLGDFINRLLKALFGPVKPLKDFLNGTWLGHSVHAALTELPIGIFALAVLFDVLNLRQAADIAVGVGVLGMLAAAVAGFADYTDTDDHPRVIATVHATVMIASLVAYVVSLWLRLANPDADRTIAIVVALVGFGLVVLGGFIGGEVVYALGNMVNRHAWRFYGTPKWTKLDVTVIPEATPTKAKAGAQTLAVVRQGTTVYALHDTCAHAGGPLSEGKLVNGCVECPWHASRYDLATGRRKSGPTTFDQPRYDVRAAEGGGWEVLRVGSGAGQNL